jgi:hypothetical protein
MGGWCAKRSKCPHYHSTSTVEPQERLCAPGLDGEVFTADPAMPFAPVAIRRGVYVAEQREQA